MSDIVGLEAIRDHVEHLVGTSKDMGIPYREIASLAGIHPSTLRRIRNREDVQWSSMQKLLSIYGRRMEIVPNEPVEEE